LAFCRRNLAGTFTFSATVRATAAGHFVAVFNANAATAVAHIDGAKYAGFTLFAPLAAVETY
jgi:hypothetical protein